MNLTIREYEASDFEACRLLWAELTQHHRDIYEDQAIGGADPGRGFETYMGNPVRQGPWVAVAVGIVIGFAGLLVYGEEGEVEPVIVSSAYRRTGIGATLVRHAMEEAKKAGVRFLSARPVARNKDAIRFLVGLGFASLGHVDLFQDLSQSRERKWKRGVRLHGNDLSY